MAIYRFSDTSAVREAVFRYAKDRPPTAFLTAKDGTAADELSTIRRAIESAGWQCIPASVDGKEVLQVSGFKEAGQCSAFLVTHHFAEGEPKITPEKGDHQTLTTRQWLQHSSLKLGGWSYLIGDMSLAASGFMKGDSKEAMGGALYTAGGAILARYGNVKTEHHVREVLERTGEFLKEEAVKLPEDCRLFTILKQRREGGIANTESFFSRYPSQVTLGVYTMGAFSMLLSGLMKKGNAMSAFGSTGTLQDKEKLSSIAYGLNSTGTKVGSLLIPEKRQYKDDEKKIKHPGTLGAVVDWFQEKPLRLFGYGALLSTGLLGWSTYNEYKNNPKQKSHIFKFVTVGSYIIGDTLLTISNKDYVNADGQFDPDEQRRIEATIAETIARQPQEIQGGLVHHVAGFLSTQPEMKGNAEQIGKEIQEQVDHFAKNPWASRTAATTPPLQPNR